MNIETAHSNQYKRAFIVLSPLLCCTAERVQVHQYWGWIYADTVYYLHLYTRRLALSAFWRKGEVQAMRPISVPPTARALAAPSHSTRTSGYCVVLAPRLGYNTGPINLRHHIDVLQCRLPTTVTAAHRAGSSSVNASYTAACPSTTRVLCLGDSVGVSIRDTDPSLTPFQRFQ